MGGGRCCGISPLRYGIAIREWQCHEAHCPRRPEVASSTGCLFLGSPRDIVDRKPWRDRNGRRRHPGEGHDVPMKVGLVDVAGLRRTRAAS
jgi:hypothetical protein